MPPGYQPYAPFTMATDSLVRAGFWKRFGALVLDSLCYGLLLFGLVYSCAIVGGFGLAIVAVLVVAAIYLYALGRTGQTWGRRIVGCKVVDESSGQPIGIGRAFGRQLFAGLVSGNVLYLGYLWMLWDTKKQTWHDKVVGSIVVDT